METLKTHGRRPTFGLFGIIDPEIYELGQANFFADPFAKSLITEQGIVGRQASVLGGILGMDLIVCYIQELTGWRS